MTKAKFPTTWKVQKQECTKRGCLKEQEEDPTIEFKEYRTTGYGPLCDCRYKLFENKKNELKQYDSEGRSYSYAPGRGVTDEDVYNSTSASYNNTLRELVYPTDEEGNTLVDTLFTADLLKPIEAANSLTFIDSAKDDLVNTVTTKREGDIIRKYVESTEYKEYYSNVLTAIKLRKCMSEGLKLTISLEQDTYIRDEITKGMVDQASKEISKNLKLCRDKSLSLERKNFVDNMQKYLNNQKLHIVYKKKNPLDAKYFEGVLNKIRNVFKAQRNIAGTLGHVNSSLNTLLDHRQSIDIDGSGEDPLQTLSNSIGDPKNLTLIPKNKQNYTSHKETFDPKKNLEQIKNNVRRRIEGKIRTDPETKAKDVLNKVKALQDNEKSLDDYIKQGQRKLKEYLKPPKTDDLIRDEDNFLSGVSNYLYFLFYADLRACYCDRPGIEPVTKSRQRNEFKGGSGKYNPTYSIKSDEKPTDQTNNSNINPSLLYETDMPIPYGCVRVKGFPVSIPNITVYFDKETGNVNSVVYDIVYGLAYKNKYLDNLSDFTIKSLIVGNRLFKQSTTDNQDNIDPQTLANTQNRPPLQPTTPINTLVQHRFYPGDFGCGNEDVTQKFIDFAKSADAEFNKEFLKQIRAVSDRALRFCKASAEYGTKLSLADATRYVEGEPNERLLNEANKASYSIGYDRDIITVRVNNLVVLSPGIPDLEAIISYEDLSQKQHTYTVLNHNFSSETNIKYVPEYNTIITYDLSGPDTAVLNYYEMTTGDLKYSITYDFKFEDFIIGENGFLFFLETGRKQVFRGYMFTDRLDAHYETFTDFTIDSIKNGRTHLLIRIHKDDDITLISNRLSNMYSAEIIITGDNAEFATMYVSSDYNRAFFVGLESNKIHLTLSTLELEANAVIQNIYLGDPQTPTLVVQTNKYIYTINIISETITRDYSIGDYEIIPIGNIPRFNFKGFEFLLRDINNTHFKLYNPVLEKETYVQDVVPLGTEFYYDTISEAVYQSSNTNTTKKVYLKLYSENDESCTITAKNVLGYMGAQTNIGNVIPETFPKFSGYLQYKEDDAVIQTFKEFTNYNDEVVNNTRFVFDNTAHVFYYDYRALHNDILIDRNDVTNLSLNLTYPTQANLDGIKYTFNVLPFETKEVDIFLGSVRQDASYSGEVETQNHDYNLFINNSPIDDSYLDTLMLNVARSHLELKGNIVVNRFSTFLQYNEINRAASRYNIDPYAISTTSSFPFYIFEEDGKLKTKSITSLDYSYENTFLGLNGHIIQNTIPIELPQKNYMLEPIFLSPMYVQKSVLNEGVSPEGLRYNRTLASYISNNTGIGSRVTVVTTEGTPVVSKLISQDNTSIRGELIGFTRPPNVGCYIRNKKELTITNIEDTSRLSPNVNSFYFRNSLFEFDDFEIIDAHTVKVIGWYMNTKGTMYNPIDTTTIATFIVPEGIFFVDDKGTDEAFSPSFETTQIMNPLGYTTLVIPLLASSIGTFTRPNVIAYRNYDDNQRVYFKINVSYLFDDPITSWDVQNGSLIQKYDCEVLILDENLDKVLSESIDTYIDNTNILEYTINTGYLNFIKPSPFYLVNFYIVDEDTGDKSNAHTFKIIN